MKSFPTLIDLVQARASERPDRCVYTFLLDGEEEGPRLTYAELDTRARAIAALLARSGTPGDRALLLYPPGLDFITAFFGALYAGMIAVPAYPPGSKRTLPRLRAIYRDAQPTVALTTEANRDRFAKAAARLPELAEIRWLTTDTVADASADEWRPPSLGGDPIAFLQYTSGSTADPKGVSVSHGNLLHNEEMIRQAFGQSPESVIVGWLPLYHDMGLIGNVLQPLYVGATCVLMSPAAFLQQPRRWLAAIGRYRATTSGGPNFAYDLCVRRIDASEKAGLDLSSWRLAFNGAEPVRSHTLERFAREFAVCGFEAEAFYPCYGLAEATLFVSGRSRVPAPLPVHETFSEAALESHRAEAALPSAGRTLVGCGQAWLGQEVAIADPESCRRLAEDAVGEIWVAGPSVARGYWRQPEVTARDFGARLAGETDAGEFLRTGDLGFLHDGELFITGRLKDLLIVRGRNHYPQDIELTAEESHEALRPGCSAAFAVDDDERLVVALEVERRAMAATRGAAAAETVADAVRQAVAEAHEVQIHEVVLLRFGAIPKTSSGKIQRHACRDAYLGGTLPAIGRSALAASAEADGAPSDSAGELGRRDLLALAEADRRPLAESYLRQQVARLTGVAADRLDPERPLTSVGLDSLTAMELGSRLAADLGTSLPFTSLLEGVGIARLTDEILEQLVPSSDAVPGEDLPVVGKTLGEHPLSYGQRAMWFLAQLAPESAAYNIAAAARLAGALDIPALGRTLERLVERHPSLRTSFPAPHGQPVQRVSESSEAGFEVAFEVAEDWDSERLEEYLGAVVNRPFDLARCPLLRICVLRRTPSVYVLVLVVHHAIADFWSLAVLLDELGAVYAAEAAGRSLDLPRLNLRYSDFARWQHELLASPEGERLEAYWRRKLAGPLPVLDLATDRPRPPVQTYDGAARGRALSADLTSRLEALGQAHGATLYMTLLAAFQTLLHRYTGQDDVLVGSPVSGRSRPELADLVGYFVDPLVLRGDLGREPSFADFLARVRRTVLDAFRHQDYPFDLLVERLKPARDPSRSPIFQVMLSLQQAPRLQTDRLDAFALGHDGARMTLGGLDWESMALPRRTAAFDLTLVAAPTADGLGLSLEYNRDLFDAGTAERMLGHFEVLLGGAAVDPRRPLACLDLLTEAERHELLAERNATVAAYPRDLSLHGLVEAQARRSPQAVALAFQTAGGPDHQLTYQALDRRAEDLAHTLRCLGVAPEVKVAICTARGPEMVIGLLAVLKAGGAYVPLDPAYPEERLAFMLEDAFADCSPRILLTGQALRDRLGALAGSAVELLCVDGDISKAPEGGPAPPPLAADSLAYVIYTSGSTGRPKGVQIPHGPVVNFLSSMRRAPGLGPRDHLLAVTTLSFDIAVLEIFLPLMVGGRVVLADHETTGDGGALARALAARRITAMQATPATWRLLVETGWQGQEDLQILSGGEALPAALAARLADLGAGLWNLYGPTETTIWSAAAHLLAGPGPVSIGGPIDNTGIYVLDRRLGPVPVSVPGEVYISGDGLARGYLRRPALTAERFLPDPFAADSGTPDSGTPDSGTPGGRLYRVGDLGRHLPDEGLEILGRVDHQVKVRGFRIELGEIETLLARHEAVAQAVVTVREDTPGDQRLVAYVTAAGDAAPGEVSLRRALQASLPDYMVPSIFVSLDALPLTPNGKVDRRALPAPKAARAGADRAAAGGVATAASEIERLVAELWCEVLGRDQVDSGDNFFDLGGHSLLVARLHSRLLERFAEDDAAGLGAAAGDLAVVDLFRYPTVGSQARFLAGEGAEAGAAARTPVARRPVEEGGDIAVIGLSCRFPGAEDPDAFWRNLRDGVESISSFSEEELAEAAVDAETFGDPAYVPARGVVKDATSFDAAFFGFNPREAEVMDPQHRIFLEGAWAALEDAGYDSERYGGRVGVFAGVGLNTYLLHLGEELLSSAAGSYQAFIGNDKDFVPTRVSYQLDLKGPSVNVQTACSSSLVAVHLACQSLLRGESDMALAGGITVRVPQRAGYRFQEGAILSADGHCRAFDAGAGGTVPGNGMGLVVLKPLAAALADGDYVRAVIKGTAINNDGKEKIGYTAPSIEGQAAVIGEALAAARIDPASLSYVEAHGTGTELGDPIEIAALRQAVGAGAGPRSCALGSVKTNLGHLDTAAGVAGLIKTVLALEHRELPPSLHFEAPNPKLELDSGPLYVNAALEPWQSPEETPRRAGVSSFGIGGTNAHVVLEEAPASPLAETAGALWPVQVLVLSARTQGALDAVTGRLAERLATDDAPDLAEVAYTLQVGRRVFDHRRMVVARDAADAAAALRDPERYRSGKQAPGARPVVFLLPGQGAQYPDMGRGLYELEPSFRADVDRCAELLEPRLELDLRAVLFPGSPDPEADQRLAQTWLTQPALFVVEYALARLWMSWGVVPRAMIGHSVGELVAACLAGVLALEDALTLVAARGRLLQVLPGGSMLAVALPRAEVETLLEGGLSLAAVNGPADCVVSGPDDRIEALGEQLSARSVRSRRLHTSHAFHSSMVEPAAGPLVDAASRIELQPPRIPYLSNVTGTWITDEEATDPAYWGRHLTSATEFAAGVETLLEDSGTVFLEVGPGRALCTLARQQARQRTFLTSLRHPREQQEDADFLLDTVGRLWLSGVEIDWRGLHAGAARRRVPLPTYAFERQRYWLEPRARSARGEARDPLARKPDLGDWFYAPVWKQSFAATSLAPASQDPEASSGAAPDAAERWLVLADPDTFGVRLAASLRASGVDVVTVAAGDGFARSAADAYTVDPGSKEDFGALLDAIASPPAQIVHAWLPGQVHGDGLRERLTTAAPRGFSSLLLLVQALGARHPETSMRLAVLSEDLYRILGRETLRPESAPLAGLLQVIPQEYSRLSCRAVDVSVPAADSPEEAALLAELARELAAPRDEESAPLAIAYRAGSRWVRAFETLPLAAAAEPPPRLREGGVYLITGGLGGVGLALAEALAGSVPCKLALVGRSADPEIAAVRALEDLGAEVLVTAADVTDPSSLALAIDRVRARFGAVHGVVHAAGVPGGGVLQTRTPEAAAEVMAPKVEGTAVLHELLADEPLDFFVLCASITGLAGGFGQGDYCAANAFLDAFAHAAARRPPGRRPPGRRPPGCQFVSLDWDRWRDVGMAASPRSAKPELAGDHPLLGGRIESDGQREVYRSVFGAEAQWVLSEHRVAGHPTVPGATYLEMARAAACDGAGGTPVAIGAVVFLEPLIVPDGQSREVLTILEPPPSAERPSDFRVVSRPVGSAGIASTWQEHVRGTVEPEAPRQALEPSQLAALEARCPEALSANASAREEGFLVTGGRWQSLLGVRVGEGELLAELELAAEHADDLETLALHPALLDIATGYVQLTREGNYLPLTYERLSVAGPLPRRLWSWTRLRGAAADDADTISCDVTLLDEDGVARATVEGFSMKRVGEEALAGLEAVDEEPLAAGVGEIPAAAAEPAPEGDDFFAGEIRAADGMEVLRRVLSADVPPQLVVSPRDLEAVTERYRGFDPSQTSTVLDALGALDVPRSSHARPELSTDYVAPAEDLERQIAEVWQQLLGVEQVGVHDNFFELGGTSLIGIQVVAELKKRLDRDIPTVGIFEAPTVSALAAYLRPRADDEPAFARTRSRVDKKKVALASRRRPRPRRARR